MIKKIFTFIICSAVIVSCEELPEELVEGCTDSNYANYNPEATYDDGSCSDCELFELSLEDSFGDGWNGADWKLFDSMGNILLQATIESGSDYYTNFSFCSDSCYVIIVNEGSFPEEIFWQVSDDNGNSIIAGGAPFSETLGNCGN